MSELDTPTSAITALQAQYLASRQEATACRSTAEQYTARASTADATADSLAAALEALGGALPAFPAPVDTDDEDYPSTPSEPRATIVE